MEQQPEKQFVVCMHSKRKFNYNQILYLGSRWNVDLAGATLYKSKKEAEKFGKIFFKNFKDWFVQEIDIQTYQEQNTFIRNTVDETLTF